MLRWDAALRAREQVQSESWPLSPSAAAFCGRLCLAPSRRASRPRVPGPHLWCASPHRSYLTPVRDEEAESLRKARSRQARQTRRSTQVSVASVF